MMVVNSVHNSVVRCTVLGALMVAAATAWCGEGGLPDRPLSNPVYTDIAQPKREINLIYMHQRLPGLIDTQIGKVPLDGHAEVMAIQLEMPLSECLSLVANKTGYVRLRPQETLTDQDGFGDISAGLKWLIRSTESSAIALRGTVELPLGNDEVFQGNGDGNISPAIIGTYWCGRWTANGVAGLIVPFDGEEESLMSYASIGGAAKVSERFSFLAELNWFHVLDDGNGSSEFSDEQGLNLVPSVVEFEGGDYFNLGSAKGDRHPDAVTAMVGARFRATEGCSLGVGYEFPLTPDSAGLMDDRLTVNLQLRF